VTELCQCLRAVQLIIDWWLNDYMELKSICALRTEFQRLNCNDVMIFDIRDTFSVLKA